MTKKVLMLILIAGLIFALTIPASACWAWGYDDVNELIHGKVIDSPESEYAPGAAIIIVGTVIDAELRGSHENRDDHAVTIAHIKVTEVLKGDISVDDIISTVSSGHDYSLAINRSGTSSSTDGPFLSINKDYLLFLWESGYDGDYFGFAGANQGAFQLDEKENIMYGEHMGIETLDTVRDLVERESNPPTGVVLGVSAVFITGAMVLASKKRCK